MVYVAAQAGYSEKETGRMSVRKWLQVFEAFKKHHNMTAARQLFAEPEKAVSVMDL